jgi:hypothetical protein
MVQVVTDTNEWEDVGVLKTVLKAEPNFDFAAEQLRRLDE